MKPIKLYWCPQTRAVRALWLLEEAGVPYERVYINIRDEKAKADPAFRAASPVGKVPAIEDGPVRISDSGAICAYIADKYPQAGLAPPIDDPQRGAYLQWLMFNNSCLEPAMVERFQNLKPNPVSHGWGSFDLVMQQLRQGVAQGPYILGERFSAADVMLASGANFMFLFGLIKPEDEPAIHAYTQRCLARPAAQRAYAANKEG
ncbi:MAG TPA: glutathione S-transferase family protein [Steroidobacteraceae bacterium]